MVEIRPTYVEPLQQFERNALTTLGNPGQLGGGGMVDAQNALRSYMANPSAARAQYTDPMASTFLSNAGNYMNQAASAARGDNLSSYMNPYQEQVINTSLNRLNEYGKKRRAELADMIGKRGTGAFGSTMTGTALGELDGELASKAADIQAGYSYQGYNDAVKRGQDTASLLSQIAGGAGNLAGTSQSIAGSAQSLALSPIQTLFDMGQQQTATSYDALRSKLGAGQYIRDYNQNLSNIAQQDLLDEGNYPRTNLSNTLALLQGFQSNTGPTARQPGFLEQLGTAVDAGIGLAR